MLSRRSLFSFLAGVGAAVTGAKVVEAKSEPDLSPQWLQDMLHPKKYEIMVDPISQSMQDEIAAAYQPVNVRADGSIRHRQHHPVDFPPRR